MKTLESIREEIWVEMKQLEDKRKDQWTDIRYQTLREVLQKLGHLDEPEVLSREWIDENKSLINGRSTNPDGTEGDCYDAHYIHVLELQNLLVPKQEEVDRAYKGGYEEGKQHTFYKGYLEGLADKEKEPETVSDVVADFYEACDRLQGVMSMKVEETEE